MKISILLIQSYYNTILHLQNEIPMLEFQISIITEVSYVRYKMSVMFTYNGI